MSWAFSLYVNVVNDIYPFLVGLLMVGKANEFTAAAGAASTSPMAQYMHIELWGALAEFIAL